jgi:predicted glycogen debranching enzyme
MTYLDLNKQKLINLEYSLGCELLRSNRSGSFASTTIIGSNTRKYHGLLICPVPALDNDNHVLLSCLDETIIQRGAEFRLGLHKYPGNVWEPKGHKYAMSFELDPVPGVIYRVGGVKLRKEMIFIENEERILIRYTLLEAHSPTSIKLQPFLAFRNIHILSKQNFDANTRTEKITGGISACLYHGYPQVYMQLSKKTEFISVPDWYRNIEYIEEQKRGYNYQEDLFVPGFFEFGIKPGESVIFSAGTKETTPAGLSKQFQKEVDGRIPRDSFWNNLKNAAQQLMIHKDNTTRILAGYHWYGVRSRDTFISVPGMTLSIGDERTFKVVIDTMSKELNGCFFPGIAPGNIIRYNSVDAPLWYIWAIQQYVNHTGKVSQWVQSHWNNVKQILTGYRNGTDYHIHMEENGLLWSGYQGIALTWMDAEINGIPVTPRSGLAVEVNALWYNAICFGLELAKKIKDREFMDEWKHLPVQISKSFTETFWLKERGYLADYVNEEKTDWSIRPNQIFSVSLPFSPVTREIWKSVVDVVQNNLLTTKGLRTVSPRNPLYEGMYGGDALAREKAFHQGTVWPWLAAPFCEAYLRVYEQSGLEQVKRIYHQFEEEMSRHGLGSISEVFDGDPPHLPNGAISMAWNIAALLRIKELIDQNEKK